MKKSFIILWLIPSAAGLAIGTMLWLVAVLLWIYRLFIFAKDGEFEIIHTINVLPDGMLDWLLNKFGRSAYWFIDMDITIPIIVMGLIFIIIGILCNSASKKYEKSGGDPATNLQQQM